MANKRYIFNENKITAQVIDQSTNHLWLAFLQDGGGNCALQKASVFDPTQLYYNIDIAVDEITKMMISGDYIYLSYNDSSLIGARYNKNTPLSSSTNFSIPSGINENPVDVTFYDNHVWYLISGSSSGENAKIVKLTTAGTFVETIDLSTITNAKSFVVDSITGDLWVVTYTSPAKLIRVYFDVTWQYTTIILD